MREAGGEAGCPGVGGWVGGLQVLGAGGRTSAPGGLRRGRGRQPESGQVRVRPGPLGQPPAPAVSGRARRGDGERAPQLPAPCWAAVLPGPLPQPLARRLRLGGAGTPGCLRVERSSGRDGSPGSPGGTGPRLTSPLPPGAPPPPRTPCTAPHGAYPCPGWMQGEES